MAARTRLGDSRRYDERDGRLRSLDRSGQPGRGRSDCQADSTSPITAYDEAGLPRPRASDTPAGSIADAIINRTRRTRTATRAGSGSAKESYKSNTTKQGPFPDASTSQRLPAESCPGSTRTR